MLYIIPAKDDANLVVTEGLGGIEEANVGGHVYFFLDDRSFQFSGDASVPRAPSPLEQVFTHFLRERAPIRKRDPFRPFLFLMFFLSLFVPLALNGRGVWGRLRLHL